MVCRVPSPLHFIILIVAGGCERGWRKRLGEARTAIQLEVLTTLTIRRAARQASDAEHVAPGYPDMLAARA